MCYVNRNVNELSVFRFITHRTDAALREYLTSIIIFGVKALQAVARHVDIVSRDSPDVGQAGSAARGALGPYRVRGAARRARGAQGAARRRGAGRCTLQREVVARSRRAVPVGSGMR